MPAKPSEEQELEALANAAKMCRVLLGATPYELIEGTGGKTRCSGQIRVSKGWGWMPCSGYSERGNSLCPGPCTTTWRP